MQQALKVVRGEDHIGQMSALYRASASQVIYLGSSGSSRPRTFSPTNFAQWLFKPVARPSRGRFRRTAASGRCLLTGRTATLLAMTVGRGRKSFSLYREDYSSDPKPSSYTSPSISMS